MKKVVKHKKNNKKYYVLGTHYDGNRGHLYKLVPVDGEDKRYKYDVPRNYTAVRRRR
jgi:hypothetical protein